MENPNAPIALTTLMDAYKDRLAESLRRLDPEQRAVSDEIVAGSPQPLVVLAGAGSGKSETMVTTVARMLAEGHYSSSDLIVTTFTRKAREELEHRLNLLVPSHLLSGLRLGTFHALAQRYMVAADPQMPDHGWKNSRNVDLIGDDDSSAERKKVQPLVERILRGIERTGREPSLSEHGWKTITFLAEQTDSEKAAREVFTKRELFGEGGKKVFARLWGLVGIPDAGSIWRRVLGDWEIPGLTTGKMKWDKALGREIPEYQRGLDVIVPNGRSAHDYAGQVEIMRGKGWNPDSPAALAQMEALEHVGYRAIRQAWKLYEEVKAHFHAFDFADVLEAYWLRGEDKARIVLVDECQDNNFVQLDVARKVAERGGGKLCLIGDVRQCIPGDQPIRVPGGFKSAREIRRGDAILAAYGGKEATEFVTEVHQTYHERAYEFETETGSTFQTTGEHLLFSALGQPEGFYVYLMWRKGYGFRVGSSQSTGVLGLKHVIVRTQQEQAERLWILGCVATGREARLLEHQIGYRFQVPMAPFKPRPDTMFTTAEEALAFFGEFKENGRVVLEAYGLHFDHPAYVAKSSARGRVAINVLLATGKGNSEVAVESQIVPTAVQAEFGFAPSKGGRTRYRKYPKSAAAALRMARTLEAAMPGDSYVVQLLSVPESDRRVFAVHANGVHPGMLVPERDTDGVVRMRRIVRRTELPVADCYDFEVSNAANFYVGNVVVHNSIYGFRGADPSVTANAPQTIGAKVMEITTNYRSGEDIVSLGNTIAEGKSWSIGSPSRSGRRGSDGQPIPGAIEMRAYNDPLEEARATAQEVRELTAAGMSPSEIAVLVRTNAAAANYELGFIMERVPVMILGSRASFFERSEIKDALALLILAEGYGGPPERLASLMRIWKTPIDTPKPFHFLGEAAFRAAVEPVAELRTLLMMDALIQSKPVIDKPQWVADASALRKQLKQLCETPWPERVKGVADLISDPPWLRGAARAGELEGNEAIDPEVIQRLDALVTISEKFETLSELIGFTKQVVNAALFFEGEDRMTKAQRAQWDAERRRRVVVSTVHKAKGLGWERVYLSATAGVFPGPRTREEDMPEEERIFYVSATRAKLTVVFTYAEHAGQAGGPSPFLDDFVAPILGAVGKLPEGWRLVSKKPLRYERADGAFVDLTEAPKAYTLQATGVDAEPEHFDTRTAALSAIQSYLAALPLIDPQEQRPSENSLTEQETPMAEQGLSTSDGLFLAYLRQMSGQAAPGLSWVALADMLLVDAELRARVMDDVRASVRSYAPVPEDREERIAQVLDDVGSRQSHWVVLPGYPALTDRAGSASLVADGRWVSVARPWKGIEPPALLRSGSIVVLDFPADGSGTEWRAYQINESGTPVQILQHTARPGGPKAATEEFHAAVAKAKSTTWRRDELSVWLAERGVDESVAADARYIYEASAGSPIGLSRMGRVEAQAADIDAQGAVRARQLSALPAERLAALTGIGLLVPGKDRSYRLALGEQAPPPPNIRGPIEKAEKPKKK